MRSATVGADVAYVSHQPESAERRAGSMLDLMEWPDWHERGACRGVDDFFDLDPLKAIALYCLDCPVIWHCRSAGDGEPYGIWAGEPKPGLPPQPADEMVVDIVREHPYALGRRELRVKARLNKGRLDALVRQLVAEGRIVAYEVPTNTPAGTRLRVVYGPGEVKP